MNAVITKLQTTKQAPKATKAPSRRKIRALRRQMLTAGAVGAVALTLTGLSLAHLAKGISLVTGASPIEAWSMGVGIDLGFVSLELAQLATGTDKLRRQMSRFASPAIAGTLAGSAALNAFAFASQADGYVMQAAGVLLGIAVPSLVYALTRVGAALASDVHGRS